MTKGQRIKAKREFLNISQTDLAKSVGVSKQTLYKYENDIITNIPSDVIERLSHHLECSPAYIMGWEVSDSTIQEYAKKLYSLDKDELDNVLQYIDFVVQKKRKEEK